MRGRVVVEGASMEVVTTRHDLRQPLTAIRACAQLALFKLARETAPACPDVTPYLSTIVAETRRLEALLVALRPTAVDSGLMDALLWADAHSLADGGSAPA